MTPMIGSGNLSRFLLRKCLLLAVDFLLLEFRYRQEILLNTGIAGGEQVAQCQFV